MNRFLTVFGAALVIAVPTRADDAGLPALLKPYVRFVEQCARYDETLAGHAGSLVEEFADATNQTWKALPTAYEPPTTELRKVDDRSVLAITAGEDEQALVAVGPRLRGDTRFELVAYSDTDEPCDLSIFLGPVAQSPGFQFGAYRNTRNLLWTDTGEDHAWQATDLPAEPLIKPREWYTVQLDLTGRELTARVNGKELGRAKLSDQFDLKRPLQPAIYCYGTTILVDRFSILRPQTGNPAELKAQAWRKTFGDLTPAAVAKKVAELIAFLDHDDSKVRDGAQKLLADAGTFVVPSLQEAAESRKPEQRLRAREILGLDTDKEAKPPPPMSDF